MNRKIFLVCLALVAVFAWTIPVPVVFAAEPIVIGVPTSLGFLEGKEAHKAVQLAVSEINAKGGVKVGATKRPFKVVAADLKSLSWRKSRQPSSSGLSDPRRCWQAWTFLPSTRCPCWAPLR
jgi:hypothetical protein